MSRLGLIVLGGITVSAMAFGAVEALAGDGNEDNIGLYSDRPACSFTPAGHEATRTIPWDGSEGVSVAIPGDTKYQRGSGDGVNVTGDANLIQHVRVREGHVEMDCRR